jgi:EAL domain-containing protein (putative c-di-GMP-specific phosphodiesterase class I)
MLGIQIREIVNLSDDSLWGHRVSVSEPAATATHPRHGTGSDVTRTADSASLPDVASIANVIIDELGTLRADATTHSLGSLQSPRVILDLPHSFWVDYSLVIRICELLRASVPGIFQNIELDCSRATPEEVSTAASLRRQGIASIVVTNCEFIDHQALRVDELKPIAYSISPEIISELASGEQNTAELRATINIARVLGILPIAVGLADNEQADRIKELGCELGVYARSDPASD